MSSNGENCTDTNQWSKYMTYVWKACQNYIVKSEKYN